MGLAVRDILFDLTLGPAARGRFSATSHGCSSCLDWLTGHQATCRAPPLSPPAHILIARGGAGKGDAAGLLYYFFFMPRRRPRPATVFLGPLRVRELVRVRWPRTGRCWRWRWPR